MRCPYCNSEVPDNYSFCTNCGQSLEQAPSSAGPAGKICNNCGAPLEPGRAFCANCGQPVGKTAQQAPPYSGAPYTPPYSASPAPVPGGKKKKTGLIAAVVILCVVLLAGGIGTALYFLVFNDNDEKKTDDVSVTRVDTDEEEEGTEEDIPAAADEEDSNIDSSDSYDTGKFDTLEDFVNSDIMQEQLGTQIAALEGTGISADVYADGDTLVYDFTIEDEAVASVMDKATLDSSLQSQASTFEGVAAMLPAAIENIDDPAVVVRYLNPSGTEITSMEFTPD